MVTPLKDRPKQIRTNGYSHFLKTTYFDIKKRDSEDLHDKKTGKTGICHIIKKANCIYKNNKIKKKQKFVHRHLLKILISRRQSDEKQTKRRTLSA